MILLQPSARATDDVAIQKHVLHPPPAPGRYALPRLPSSRVPSLSWLCLQRLAEFPDEVHHLGVRLRVPDGAPLAADIADAVHSPGSVDPRLWATLVQVYDNLPAHVASFSAPLADPHVPLLQRIPATPRFSLLTVLDLPACSHVTDDTVGELRQLHSLAALDASATALSSYALTVLARTLQWSGNRRRCGPWGLRILRLRDCAAVDNSVYPHLSRFPLLSVIDLRGTRCTPSATIHDSFHPADATQASLYHPASLHAALQVISSPNPLYSSPHTFTLHINSLYHGPPLARLIPSTVALQNTFVVIPPTAHSAIKIGDSEALRRRTERIEEERRREENKEAWYARNPQLTRNGDEEDGWSDPDTAQTSDSYDDLSDSDEEGGFSMHRSKAPPISRPVALPPLPPRREGNVARTAQHPIASSSTSNPIPSHTRPAHRRPTTLASSSWIGNTNAPSVSRRSSMPLQRPTSLLTRPMPRSSFSGSSSSAPPPPMQRPLISTSTAAFYSTAPTNPQAPPRSKLKSRASGWDWDYSADRYYSEARRERQGKHDAALMLYRPPPPWGDLPAEGVNPRDACGERKDVLAENGVLPVRRVGRVVAVIDQKRIDAVRKKEGEKQAALVALQESAKRRGGVLVGRKGWDGEGGTGTPVEGNTNANSRTAVNMGRNPFRRRVAMDIGESGGGEAKPLKPISAVKIPLLPESALEREPKRSKNTSDVKVASPSTACGRSTSSSSCNTAVIVTGHKLRPTRALPGDENTKRKLTVSSGSELRTKKSKLSQPGRAIDVKATPTPSKGTGSQQGFNWSKWGVK